LELRGNGEHADKKNIATLESRMKKLKAHGKEVVAMQKEKQRIARKYPGLNGIIEIGGPTELHGKGGGFIRYPRVHFAPKKKGC